MSSASLPMSANATSEAPTESKVVDEAVAAVRDKAREFGRLPPAAKAGLLRECIPRLLDAAPGWAAAGARARDATPGEEWMVGPMPTIRMFRLLADSLDAISTSGRPPLGRRARTRADGRLEVTVFPNSAIDQVSFGGFSGHLLLQPGVTHDRARELQAAFYQTREPAGGVSLILGAGNVSSIPPMDVASKLFVEGFVCVLKMNPVNEWVGPFLERALAPLISRGYLRVVYGGAEVGQHLVYHKGIDDVHITGSDRTHDLIVWGPPGGERDRRMAEGKPLLQIPISSELGNVSPVAIVPAHYTDDELWFQAKNVVTMVVNNASFNCNAAKMLVTARGWGQRDRFLDLVGKGLAAVPTRRAYYPGAFHRYRTLLEGRAAQTFGRTTDDNLAWALIRDVDATRADEPLFRVEPFCGILSETTVGSPDAVDFLEAATTFMNDRLWGTLNAAIVIPGKLETDPTVGAALDRAVCDLRYGTVGINHWPAVSYAVGTLAWGGHPSASLADIQSGLGWVHNTYLVGGIDKSVLRGNLVVRPKPMWFYDNAKVGAVAPAATRMEADPSFWKLPGLIARALV
jgi:aldehyde dehydrogenase (NAD(P)+)